MVARIEHPLFSKSLDPPLHRLFRNIDHRDQCYEWFLRRKGQCKGKTKFLADNAFLNQLNDHTQPPSQTKAKTAKIKNISNIEQERQMTLRNKC